MSWKWPTGWKSVHLPDDTLEDFALEMELAEMMSDFEEEEPGRLWRAAEAAGACESGQLGGWNRRQLLGRCTRCNARLWISTITDRDQCPRRLWPHRLPDQISALLSRSSDALGDLEF